jgi:hypothetical protein
MPANCAPLSVSLSVSLIVVHQNQLGRPMSNRAEGSESKSKKLADSTFGPDRLLQALTSVLDRELLRPLIGIIAGYAREADWSRATANPISLGEPPLLRCALLIDRERVLWSDYPKSRVRAMTIADLKVGAERSGTSDTSSSALNPAVSVLAGPLGVSEAVSNAAHSLYRPSCMAVEPVTQWPAGAITTAAAASSAVGLADQVGAGALWVTDCGCDRIVRIDEKSGAACVVAGVG